MSSMSLGHEESLPTFEKALGYEFSDRALLARALTHSSFANEMGSLGTIRDNETLEFLGDGILGFLVAEQLLESYPSFSEGQLSKARSHLVSEGHFAAKARALGLGGLIRLTEGESRSGGRLRDSLLADAFEAVFAALYLDGGFDKTREIAKRLFAKDVASLDPADLSFHDYKTTLQELAQGEGNPLPVYRLLEESGPDHAKLFIYEVEYAGTLKATGAGPSKKEAQRQAAKALLVQKLRETSGG